ncbi:O-antigen ligase family protein [Streptomyces gobiensis]|nr:O-antigen ligase family protein [Streptomyces gobiensis]UGY94963.1 O-antigen ligase family protein [Streptomyces gobiensis]
MAALWPVLPAVATVLLLSGPIALVDTADASAAGRITLADVASALLVVYCAVRVLRARSRPLSWPAAVILAAPAGAFAVATVASSDPAASLTGFIRYLQVFVLVPAALLLLLRGRRDFRLVAGSVLLLALVQGAIGVQQYLTGTGASYQGQDIRAVGTFGAVHVMSMATVVSHGVIIALSLGLAPPAGSPRWFRPAALGCAAALLVPLTLSFSRGAWIATAVAGTAVLLLAGLRLALRTFTVLMAAIVVLVGGAGVGSDLIGQRLSSITQVTAAPDRSVTDRYAMWAAAVSMWRDHPATGVGLKGFPAHRDGHASVGLSSASDTAGAGMEFQREPLLSPHNMYLLVLSEQGLIGVTALVGGWAALLACGLRRLATARPRGPAADCGLIAAGLLIWQLVDFGYTDIGGPTSVLTAVVFGLVAWWALRPGARTGDEAVAR